MRTLLFSVMLSVAVSGAYGITEINGEIASVDIENGSLEISGVKIGAGEAEIKDIADNPIKLFELKPGKRVEVTGISNGPGQLRAMQIKEAPGTSDRIEGKIDKADKSAKTIIVGGLTVKVQMDTVLKDQLNKMIKFKELVTGSIVGCGGNWTGPNQFTAKRIKLE